MTPNFIINCLAMFGAVMVVIVSATFILGALLLFERYQHERKMERLDREIKERLIKNGKYLDSIDREVWK